MTSDSIAEENTHTLKVTADKSKSTQRLMAEIQLSPNLVNVLATQSFLGKITGEVDLTEAVEVMKEKSRKIVDGDLSELESTLTAQVISLNAIFTVLAKRANASEYLNQMETNLRLALKAQTQCARTIEVLAAMKNPPIVFAKQANIAQGHQQINNGNQFTTHTGKTKNPSNELLNEANNAPLDTRGTLAASGANQELAAVETVNRGKNAGRQSQIKPECL